ncbi:hypothetical protein ElyMa_000980700, partial [Elysia marginata]
MGAHPTRILENDNFTQLRTLNLSSPFLQVESTSLSIPLTHTTPPTTEIAPTRLAQILLHVPRLNPSCEDITALAYQGGWCGGARNPADYLESNKHRLSCRLRCGETASYGEFPANCACDEQCLIHDDCCTDMSTVCPMVYAAGNRKYRHLASRFGVCTKYFTFVNCDSNPVISCLCGDYVHRELMQNVCLGKGNDLTSFEKILRNDLFSKVMLLWVQLPIPERTGQCNVFNLSGLSYPARVDLNLPNSQNDRVIHMRVLPVVQLNTNSSDLEHPTHSIGEANGSGSVGTANSTETNRQANEGLSFKVAFTNTIERRMR